MLQDTDFEQNRIYHVLLIKKTDSLFCVRVIWVINQYNILSVTYIVSWRNSMS